MSKGFFEVPVAINEPVKSYAPGTPERDPKITLNFFISGFNLATSFHYAICMNGLLRIRLIFYFSINRIQLLLCITKSTS